MCYLIYVGLRLDEGFTGTMSVRATVLTTLLFITWASEALQTERVVLTKLVSSEAGDIKEEDVITVENSTATETDHRDSRGLLNKLSFLAGLKSGGLVSSSGTLAASNSLRIFGKVMNSALSVSYGHVNDLDPLPEVHADEQQKPVKENRIDDVNRIAQMKRNLVKHHNNQVSRLNNKFLRSETNQ